MGGGGGEEGQARAQGGPLGGDNGAMALEKMMEMMRLQGEQLQLLAASTSGLRKEVEELKSSKGKGKEEEEKEEPIPPITAANVARMEAAPHLPRWMSGQCKLLRELLGGLGEEWADEGLEGVEGGEGGAGADADITLSDLEDGGTPRDRFAWGISVGMVRNQREYGTKWGGSKRGGLGRGRGGGWGCYYAAGVFSGGGRGTAPGGAVL